MSQGSHKHTHRKHRRRAPAGTAPGVLPETSFGGSFEITATTYGPDGFHTQKVTSVEQAARLRRPNNVLWMHLEGTADTETLRAIGRTFGVHNLALEDIANQHTRAKVEAYGERGFIVLPHLRWIDGVEVSPLPILFGKDFLLSFLDHPSPFLASIRERLANQTALAARAQAEYLAYALVDALVDDIFPVLEHASEALSNVEQDIAQSPSDTTLARIHLLRRQLTYLHRTVWPMRDAINDLVWECKDLFSEETRLFLRDCADHMYQAIDAVESLRDGSSNLVEMHISASNNRMNEIIKVLTIISTIFIPLNFIVGIYGMNFHHMPELDWVYGYPMVLGFLGLVCASMLVYFWRRGWIR
jgi:magnesium transporter